MIMSVNSCVCCGAIIPDGRMICPACESKEVESMCSTCNYQNYEKAGPFVLEHSLGFGSLVIRYYTEAKAYKLAVKDEQKSEFHVYRCPSCGKKLY